MPTIDTVADTSVRQASRATRRPKTDAPAKPKPKQLKPFRVTMFLSEVCDESGFSVAHVYRQLQAGLLKAHKAGKRTVVFRRDFDAWLNALPEAN